MKDLWQRIAAGVLACLVVLGAALWMTNRQNNGTRTDGLFYQASGIHPDAKLLTVDGETVTAEEYLYWLAYGCEYLTSNLGQVDWNASLTDGMTYGDYAKADALETVKLFTVIRQMAEENGISLTEEDQARLQEQKDNYAAYYGGEEAYHRQVELMGVSEEMYDRINATYLMLDHLTDLAVKEGGSLYPAPEDLLSYGDENGYVSARILYLWSPGGLWRRTMSSACGSWMPTGPMRCWDSWRRIWAWKSRSRIIPSMPIRRIPPSSVPSPPWRRARSATCCPRTAAFTWLSGGR